MGGMIYPWGIESVRILPRNIHHAPRPRGAEGDGKPDYRELMYEKEREKRRRK